MSFVKINIFATILSIILKQFQDNASKIFLAVGVKLYGVYVKSLTSRTESCTTEIIVQFVINLNAIFLTEIQYTQKS